MRLNLELSNLRGFRSMSTQRGLGNTMRWPDAGEKTRELPKLYSLPHLTHGVKVIGQVVHGVQHLRQQLVRRVKMPQICPRVPGTDFASASRVERTFICGEAGILDGDTAFGGKQQ